MNGGLLDVVLDGVEKGALVDNEDRKVLEELREGRDGFGYLREFACACLKVGVRILE